MTKPCEASCPKCGGTDIARQFHKRDALIEAAEYNVSPLPGWSGGSGSRFWATRDLIHHHCRTCQYGWVDKPLSKRKDARPQPTVELLREVYSAALCGQCTPSSKECKGCLGELHARVESVLAAPSVSP